jgi:SAM-dependent methyltransferase
MVLYKGFADLYAKGPYCFSEKLVQYLPKIFKKHCIRPVNIMDLCCGDGRFAILMAKKGFAVTGVDGSPYMIKYAKERSRKARLKIDFSVQKMQDLTVQTRYDLVTCWYDSINYLLTKRQLDKMFRNVYRILKDGAFFIFDINTIYGLKVNWPGTSPCVVQNNNTQFEMHVCPGTFKKNTAVLNIIGFTKKGRTWTRIEEIHRERGYRLNTIRGSFKKTRFRELGCWESLKTMKRPRHDSGKVFFLLQKKTVIHH